MTTGPASHEQRDRADSFGAIAEDYDRYRPSYPTALVDDLVALRPAHVLDVGTGTGIAARLLVARGLDVLGLEPDARMAAVARRRGLRVEVARFEEWDAGTRRFELITCAQAWHWVDPARGAPKAARLLAPGGALALFWNYSSLDDDLRALLDPVYARHAPALISTSAEDARRHDLAPRIADLKAYGGFDDVTTRAYGWERVESVDHFLARNATTSDHLLLGAPRVAALSAALREVLDEHGDTVRTRGATHLVLARRTGAVQ